MRNNVMLKYNHQTVPILSPLGEYVDIDVMLVPIIQHLWEEGVETTYSCQGGLDNEGGATPTTLGYISVVGGTPRRVVNAALRFYGIHVFCWDSPYTPYPDGEKVVRFQPLGDNFYYE